MIKSPLKWAGGKARVMPQLLEHLPKADCLIEPFVGGGTVFMNTEYRRYVLCDSNRALINFFEMLTRHTEELIKALGCSFRMETLVRTITPAAMDLISLVKIASLAAELRAKCSGRRCFFISIGTGTTGFTV